MENLNSAPINRASAQTITGYYSRKYSQFNKINTDGTLDFDTQRQTCYFNVRYAEVLLNCAEASIKLGKTDAAGYINEIRNRAGLPNYDGNDLWNEMKLQRRLEFAFECPGFRYFDLLRWGDTMRNVADYLNNPQILLSIKKIMESNEALKHEMEAIRREQVAEWAAKIVDSTPERGGMRLMATQTDRRPDFIKDLAFAVRSRSKNIVLVIGSINDGKPTLTVALGDDIVAQGVNAGVVVREAAKAINGGGGGQPFLATAGGKNPDGIQAAIDKAVELIVEQVK